MLLMLQVTTFDSKVSVISLKTMPNYNNWTAENQPNVNREKKNKKHLLNWINNEQTYTEAKSRDQISNANMKSQ